jgi:endopeptidase Clp ATP-binding regulatory subunit ClpX
MIIIQETILPFSKRLNTMTDKKLPTPEEVQKEFEDFVRQRFGSNVQVVTNHIGSTFDNDETGQVEDRGIPEKFDLNFNMTPKEVKNYLDDYIIKQDEAKKALAIAICDHYNHVKACLENTVDPLEEYSKQNVLVLGPTGVGKTYLVRKIAELIGVPFVKADATRFSETGYVGANVDDLVRDLVGQAGGDIEKAQYGIVYLDEADKLATRGNTAGRDVNGRGVQFGLLRLMEEAEVDLKSGNDIRSQMQFFMEMQKNGKPSKSVVNTANILFIVSGAFHGLEEIIQKRLNTNAIGFGADKRSVISEDDIFIHAQTEDFIQYGFEPEFVGRLPVRVSCQHLNSEDLYNILVNAKGSIVRQYINAFKAYGIDVDFNEEALHRIAELAAKERTGARALMTVCENALREFKFELPSLPIKRFTVTAETIDTPQEVLRRLLSENQFVQHEIMLSEIRNYERSFLDRTGIRILFNSEASEKIIKNCLSNEMQVSHYCDQILKSYDHGLSIIQNTTAQNFFILSAEVIDHPQETLEKMIKEHFSKNKQEYPHVEKHA